MFSLRRNNRNVQRILHSENTLSFHHALVTTDRYTSNTTFFVTICLIIMISVTTSHFISKSLLLHFLSHLKPNDQISVKADCVLGQKPYMYKTIFQNNDFSGSQKLCVV